MFSILFGVSCQRIHLNGLDDFSVPRLQHLAKALPFCTWMFENGTCNVHEWGLKPAVGVDLGLNPQCTTHNQLKSPLSGFLSPSVKQITIPTPQVLCVCVCVCVIRSYMEACSAVRAQEMSNSCLGISNPVSPTHVLHDCCGPSFPFSKKIALR